jgi:hypothetical protein
MILDIQPNYGIASICRSKFYSGLPLAGFYNTKERKAEQEELLEELQGDHLYTFLDDRTSVGDMDMYFSSSALNKESEDRARVFGLFLMIGSLLTVLLALWFLTGSLFLSSAFLIQLLGTYVWTVLVYRIIINFQYMGLYQYLNIFVVGSISLVHFFQYFTTWNSPACREIESVDEKIEFVHIRTKRTLLVSTCVSMLSLFVSSSSYLLVVTTVDVFGGILILINFISVHVMFPAAFATWQTVFSSRPWFSCCSSGGDKTSKKSVTKFFGRDFATGFLGQPFIRWVCAALGIIIVIAFLIIAIVRVKLDRTQV